MLKIPKGAGTEKFTFHLTVPRHHYIQQNHLSTNFKNLLKN